MPKKIAGLLQNVDVGDYVEHKIDCLYCRLNEEQGRVTFSPDLPTAKFDKLQLCTVGEAC